jgi:Rad3-related DNA helicase
VIRHRFDYGVIFLIDERWKYMHTKLSKWLQPSIYLNNSIEGQEVLKTLNKMAEECKKNEKEAKNN